MRILLLLLMLALQSTCYGQHIVRPPVKTQKQLLAEYNQMMERASVRARRREEQRELRYNSGPFMHMEDMPLARWNKQMVMSFLIEDVIQSNTKWSGKNYMTLEGCKEKEWGENKTRATPYRVGFAKGAKTFGEGILVVFKKPNGKFLVVKWENLNLHDRKCIEGEIRTTRRIALK